MNYRKAVLLDNETATTAATKTLDLKGLDPISRLIVMMSGTNNGATPTAVPAKMVSKIELVDGSDVFWSLSGIEAQALHWYQTGKEPANINSFLNDNTVRAQFPINFGRWLWDEDLAFDPARFKNPQLKITHNKASGGSSPDAGNLDVVADMFDEKRVSPIGWLMAKEHYTYSLTSSAVEKFDLPTDYPMRQLIIQSLSSTKAPNSQYNKIKLSENNGKKIPIEESTSDLIKQFAADFGAYKETNRNRGSTSDVTNYVTPTYETFIVGNTTDAAAGYVSITSSYGGTASVKVSTAADLDLFVQGYCPHGAMAIPFGDLWDINNWYDVTKLAKLELSITAGSSVGSSSTCEAITEQLRRY